ncbi:MAG TPA: arginine--tRNA ligase [Pyrinomonadaceae bacterium]|jgi:arginyl-tRNA synthetase|nr:arginine--tRNA ligase [Pyrinomonadaceae bacterium]
MMNEKLTPSDLAETLRERVRATARERFNVALEKIGAETPPRTELGDLAFPVAFELAKRIKQATGEKANPRAIAEELRAALERETGVARAEVAGAGYINVFYDRAAVFASLAGREETVEGISAEQGRESEGSKGKVIVEHTNVNPNKAAHIGHLRNAVLGDTFVRILRAAGESVEVDNYIDNTGVQVADVVVGFTHLEHMTLADVRRLDEGLPPERPFDFYCWDLYARVGLFYRHDDPEAKPDPELLKLRVETLHALEAGDNPTAELADYVATRVVERHLRTMLRLGIQYDLLPRESDILKLGFWQRAFERLKETGAIRFETEGRHAGCWVLPTDLHASTDEHEADKIIVRSNGTVTYAGKDIAYQLWKLGELGLDFRYKSFHTYEDGHRVWMTTSDEGEDADAAGRPGFGGGRVVYNVIDTRQSYTQEVVQKGTAAVTSQAAHEASVHLDYEVVALSPAACEELGIELSQEDRARAHIEMSGRRGLGVKADDLIDKIESSALAEVAARHPELADDERGKTAHLIAVGALRYFLLKWTRNSIIAFDFKEALSFEGETGPYCQYAAVRANSIFRKLDEASRAGASQFVGGAAGDEKSAGEIREVFSGEGGDELWSLVSLGSRLDDALAQAAAQAEPAHLAKYAFQLARAFNLFYHRHRILAEENAARRNVLICVASLTRDRLTDALTVLGIEVPDRM